MIWPWPPTATKRLSARVMSNNKDLWARSVCTEAVFNGSCHSALANEGTKKAIIRHPNCKVFGAKPRIHSRIDVNNIVCMLQLLYFIFWQAASLYATFALC